MTAEDCKTCHGTGVCNAIAHTNTANPPGLAWVRRVWSAGTATGRGRFRPATAADEKMCGQNGKTCVVNI